MPKFYNFEDPELFEDFAAEFDPMNTDRQTRRKRKTKARHEPKKAQDKIVEELADDTGIAGGFKITYNAGDNDHHQLQWIQDSMSGFFYQDLIVDVMAMVKGGKEASVYRCQAHDSTEYTWLAAKVYRPRMFRNLRNDKMYRQGRQALGADGKVINAKDWRTLKAMNKGTGYGQAQSHTSWLMYEFTTLKKLYEAGASVPKPIETSSNAILMEYIGDSQLAAPTLSQVKLHDSEVEYLFKEVMRNIHLMLQQGIVHGDLSAYNILYWDGEIVLIDFPQVVEIDGNPHARKILERDIQRVCEYFEGCGMTIDHKRITRNLWKSYGVADADPAVILFNILEAVSFDDYEPREDDDF